MKSETTDALIQEWERMLAANEPIKIPDVYFSYSDEQNHEEACCLFRYVFENILDWSPHDAMNYLSAEIVEKLGLSKAYSKLIWPSEIKSGRSVKVFDARSTYGYVAALCYPSVIREFDMHNLWIMEYNRELSGEKRATIKNFEGENGYDKARLLLNYWLINHPEERFTDLETMYAFFASDEAVAFLKNIKLWNPCEIFFSSPLEYFHESLTEDEGDPSAKSEFLLQFTEFNMMKRKMETKVESETNVDEKSKLSNK